MKETLSTVLGNLRTISAVEAVWRRGAVHRGGPHYRLRGTLGPISIGVDECMVLGKSIELLRPRKCFVVGNAFGLSSVFLAKMVEFHGGEAIVTLDNESEGHGARCAEIARELARQTSCRLLTNIKGSSPEDIVRTAAGSTYDFVFIDGLHRHPQVSRDFDEVRKIAGPETLFWWHDFWMPGIPQCVAHAQSIGFHCRKVNSSCEMVFGTRSAEVYEKVCGLYANTEAPRKRLRPVAFLKLCHVLATGLVKSRIQPNT
jgi:predicted O-methyltransferase YrrM